jgi:hypothetical protein
MITSHIAAPMAKVSGARLAKDHGSTVDRPKPDPAVNNMMEIAIAPSAPPMIAPQSVARPAVAAPGDVLPTTPSPTSVTAIAGSRAMLPPMVRIDDENVQAGNENWR